MLVIKLLRNNRKETNNMDNENNVNNENEELDNNIVTLKDEDGNDITLNFLI